MKLPWRFFNEKDDRDGFVWDAPANEFHSASTYRIRRKAKGSRDWYLSWNGIPMCEQPDASGCERYADLHYRGEWENQDAVKEIRGTLIWEALIDGPEKIVSEKWSAAHPWQCCYIGDMGVPVFGRTFSTCMDAAKARYQLALEYGDDNVCILYQGRFSHYGPMTEPTR